MERLTHVERINITRRAEQSCPVCQAPLAEALSFSCHLCPYPHKLTTLSPSHRWARCASRQQLRGPHQSVVDPHPLRISRITPGTVSVTSLVRCNAGRRITPTCKQSVSMEERKCPGNVTPWDRARMGSTCPEPPACSRGNTG